MIRSKTTFVVGAGASFEVGLPLGIDLTTQIARVLNQRKNAVHDGAGEWAYGAILTLAHEELRSHDELLAKAANMSGALTTASSIDVFIDNHSHDPDVGILGKIGIAARLIEAEQGSMLSKMAQGRLDLIKPRETWLGRLFYILSEGVKATAIEAMFSNISFIVFNYDRCLEFYLQHAIASRFQIELARAKQIVDKSCRIIHPYGTLGPLIGPEKIDFAQPLRSDTYGAGGVILRMSRNLRTFAEASEQAKADDIKKLVAEADRLVFLGFGFQRQNVDLLVPPSRRAADFRSTVYRMSQSNKREVRARIHKLLQYPTMGDEHKLQDETCADFISAEQLYLSS